MRTVTLIIAIVMASIATARAQEKQPWEPMTRAERAKCVNELLDSGAERRQAQHLCDPANWATPPALGWVCGDRVEAPPVREPGGLKNKRYLFCD
jgi:hypothetical protein